ncbi:Hypothetical predicted protein [Xyrichtys novacula]|uniref:Uncharacterized protein n=1 Tax=Xyrichtys novacula TaxID=13765 RepID=A0AAV1FFN0_XYRNO|nr:Hypothetical predicted protein [Xyrichtys novacula]
MSHVSGPRAHADAPLLVFMPNQSPITVLDLILPFLHANGMRRPSFNQHPSVPLHEHSLVGMRRMLCHSLRNLNKKEGLFLVGSHTFNQMSSGHFSKVVKLHVSFTETKVHLLNFDLWHLVSTFSSCPALTTKAKKETFFE